MIKKIVIRDVASYDHEGEFIHVFNKKFKEDNQRDHILGVYKLGPTWVTLEKQREAIREKRDELSDQLFVKLGQEQHYSMMMREHEKH